MTRGLLGAAHPAELEGLLAHEVAHIRRRDVAIQTLVAMLTLTILELSRLGWRAQSALLYILGPIASSFTNAFIAMLLTERHSGRTRGLYCGGMSPQSNANLPQNPSLRLNKVKSGGRGSPRPDRSELESCNKNEEI